MKKIFLEPEIVRIDVKMTENIAVSGTTGNEVINYYVVSHDGINGIITAKIDSMSCYEILVNSGDPPAYHLDQLGNYTSNFFEALKAYNNGCLIPL